MKRRVLCAVGCLLATGLNTSGEVPAFEEWDGLLAKTGTPPIKINEESISTATANEQYYEWMKKKWFAAEFEEMKADPEEAKLVPLLEYSLRTAAGLEVGAIPGNASQQAGAVIAGEKRRPSADFLCAHLLRSSNYYYPGMHGYSKVATAPAEAKIPTIFRLIARARLVVHAQELDKKNLKTAEKRYYEVLDQFLKEKCEGEDARWTVYLMVSSVLETVRKKREKRHAELFEKSKIEEWARLTLVGVARYEWGWMASGRGWGNPQKNGRKILQQQLPKARKALTRAWELKKSVPYAATQMIIILEVGGVQDGESLRLWLDRATAGQFDYFPAYRVFLNANRPYWRGRTVDMLAFGKVCADTKRYDTELPTILNESFVRVAMDMDDWREIYSDPGYAKLISGIRKHRVLGSEGTPNYVNHNSQLFLESWLIGDYQEAYAALKRNKTEKGHLITRETRNAAARFNVNHVFLQCDVMLRGGKTRLDYEAGLEAKEKGHYEEALQRFQAAQKVQDPIGAHLLKGEVELAKFQKKFATGEWTKMPLDTWHCWLDLEGDASWMEESKRMRFTSTWEFGKTLFRGTLGENFEVRGKLHHSRPPYPGGLAIFCGHSPYGTGRSAAWWRTMRVDCAGPKQSKFQFVHKYSGARDESKLPRLNTLKQNEFLFRRMEGTVTFKMGGKILQEGDLGDRYPAGEAAFGFGILGHGKGSWSEVWDVEARKLETKGREGDGEASIED